VFNNSQLQSWVLVCGQRKGPDAYEKFHFSGIIIAERLSAKQLLCQCKPIPPSVCIYIMYNYVAIVIHAQECNYQLKLKHVQWYIMVPHACV